MLGKGLGVAKPEWGTKRTCDKCGARYYDLNRNPAVCPQCGTQCANKPPAKASAAAKASPPEARDMKPALNDEATQAMNAVADDDNDDEEEEKDIDATDKDGELIEDASDLVEDADDVAQVVDNRDDANAAKE